MTRGKATIVFDWNGTLLADVSHSLRATNTALKLLGREPVSLEHYRAHYQVPIAHIYMAFGCDMGELISRTAEVHDLWNRTYDAGAKTARLRRGARMALKALKEQKHRSIILSNHTTENISSHINRLGIHGHFETILAYDHYGASFTRVAKGEKLRRYLEQNGINEGVIVGDTEEEIEIARSHGLISIAITDGVCSVKRLRAAKPDFLISNLAEIPPIAERVFSRSRKGA